MIVLGLDIGYSNVKIAYGNGKEPVTKIMPAGAAPENNTAHSLSGAHNEGNKVLISNKEWLSCVSPERFENWERTLHEKYIESESYLALFYGALLETKKNIIDVVVTGLPVSHCTKENIEILKKRLKGTHKVTSSKNIEVKDVVVVEQPVGSYMDAIWNTNDELLESLEEGMVVIIDPGHYSVDWVVIEQQSLRKQARGTSHAAMSSLIDKIGELIESETGAVINPSRIETTLKAKNDKIMVHGKKVDFKTYVSKASLEITKIAISSVKTQMRKEKNSADVLILTGGGANFYQNEANKAFSKQVVYIPNEPVLSNAKVFYYFGTTK